MRANEVRALRSPVLAAAAQPAPRGCSATAVPSQLAAGEGQGRYLFLILFVFLRRGTEAGKHARVHVSPSPGARARHLHQRPPAAGVTSYALLFRDFLFNLPQRPGEGEATRRARPEHLALTTFFPLLGTL